MWFDFQVDFGTVDNVNSEMMIFEEGCQVLHMYFNNPWFPGTVLMLNVNFVTINGADN